MHLMQRFMPWPVLAAAAFLTIKVVDGTPNESHKENAVVHANTEFTISMVQLLASRKINTNLVISPWGISLDFAMLAAGARDASLVQLQRVFKWKHVHHNLQREMGRLFNGTQHENTNGVMSTVVAKIWIKKDQEVSRLFIKVLKDNYDAEIGTANFLKPDEATQQINAWIAEKTHNKIQNMFERGSLKSDTRLVVANAAFFKGQWLKSFDKKYTTKKTFYGKEKTMMVDMMYQNSDYKYSYDENLKSRILEMPYGGKTYSMFILLPTKKDGIHYLLASLSSTKLHKALTNMKKINTDVYLPKIHLKSTLDLKDILTKLGVSDIFSAKADLSGITGNNNLYISTAVQKNDLAINEEGTIAAAGTGIGGAAMNMPPQFIADHPFLFFIMDNRYGLVTFTGVVRDPTTS